MISFESNWMSCPNMLQKLTEIDFFANRSKELYWKRKRKLELTKKRNMNEEISWKYRRHQLSDYISQSLPCVQRMHVKLERMRTQCHLPELVHSSDCLLSQNARTMRAEFFGPFARMAEWEKDREESDGDREQRRWKEQQCPICRQAFLFATTCKQFRRNVISPNVVPFRFFSISA